MRSSSFNKRQINDIYFQYIAYSYVPFCKYHLCLPLRFFPVLYFILQFRIYFVASKMKNLIKNTPLITDNWRVEFHFEWKAQKVYFIILRYLFSWFQIQNVNRQTNNENIFPINFGFFDSIRDQLLLSIK